MHERRELQTRQEVQTESKAQNNGETPVKAMMKRHKKTQKNKKGSKM